MALCLVHTLNEIMYVNKTPNTFEKGHLMVNKYQLFDTLVFHDQQKQHWYGTNIPCEDIYYKANKCSAKMDMDIGHVAFEEEIIYQAQKLINIGIIS